MKAKPKKILVVDDERVMIKLLDFNLTKAGYEVKTVSNGQEALRILDSYRPDLIICDIMMPVMDGLELRQRLRQEHDYQLIPFIFLTAKTQTEDRISGFKLGVDDYIGKPFSPDELQVRVASILERRSRFEQLMNYDFLTGIFNRRMLESNLEFELKRALRYHHPLSVLIFDIDRFKSINDVHGHSIGDIILKDVVATVKQHIRDIDILGRLGGEEFALMMPDTDRSAATNVANRCRQKVSEQPYSDKNLNVTFSGGIATAPDDATSVLELLNVADGALYQAKETGRNRIVATSPK